MMKTVALIGLGAIGLAYAAHLQEGLGEDFFVLVDQDRKTRYEEEGFFINEKKVAFSYRTPKEVEAPVDLLLISVKHHHLDQVIETIAPLVGEETVILSLLNGITSEERIAKVYGEKHLLYGNCVRIDAVRSKNTVTFSSSGAIHFGEKDGRKTQRVEAVTAIFERAKMEYALPDDMWRAMWWKFMVNVGINQPSAVLKAPYRVFKECPEARELMIATMEEVITLAKAEGVDLERKDVDVFLEILDQLGDDKMTSMCQDMVAGRKTEVEMFAGEVMARAQKRGLAMPINETLYRQIKSLEYQNGVYR